MRLARAILAPIALLAMAGTARAQDMRTYDALLEQDLRLARIAEQIQGANVDLCVETMPLTGMLLHSSDQYSSPPDGWFANGEVEVLGVVPGSPAALAGIEAGDGLVAVAGTTVADLRGAEERPLRDDVFWHLADLRGELHVSFSRAGQLHEVAMTAPMGCRSLVEILADNGDEARSDGRVIQISYGIADRLDDEGLAVVFAHELGHTVLLHRIRLREADVRKGFFGEFGRNRRISREVEVEADRMAVYLLYNAGYKPEIAPAFWSSEASNFVGGGLLRSRVYPSRSRRTEIAQQEVDILAQRATAPPYIPEQLLARRDVPFED